MPDLSGLIEMWSAICGSEIAAAHAATYPSRASEYGPYMREFLAMGTRVTPQQLVAARERREAFAARFTAVLESVDAIAGPSGGDPAWPITHAIQVGSLPDYHKAWSTAAPRRAAPSSRCRWIWPGCRDLLAVRLFCGRSAVQHPVHWPTARRVDAVPHRP